MQSRDLFNKDIGYYKTHNHKNTTSTMIRFNETLNQSSSLTQRMDWFKSYREKITHWLHMFITEQQLSNLCVIAAGNLADIEYSTLQGTSLTSVTLTDIDLTAMQAGYTYQKLDQDSQQPLFSLKALNYLGEDSDSHILRFLYEMRQNPQNPKERMDNLICKISQSMDRMKKNSTISPGGTEETCFDGVLVLPIYTQLLFFQLDVELYGVPSWQARRHYFFNRMATIIECFNVWVVSLLKPGGSLLVFSDIMEEKVTTSNTPELTAQNICTTIEQYEALYGSGLGSYGLANMSELVSQQEEYFLPWEFDQERRFLVKGARFLAPK